MPDISGTPERGRPLILTLSPVREGEGDSRGTPLIMTLSRLRDDAIAEHPDLRV